tara:strand:+ start:1031 stop:1315 length:285 start_codon:yes stop_codon:yes gene_type:complete
VRYKLNDDDKTLAHNKAGLTLSGAAGSGVLTKPKMTQEQEDRYNAAVARRANVPTTEMKMRFFLDESIPKNQFLKIYNERFGRTPYNQWYKPVV